MDFFVRNQRTQKVLLTLAAMMLLASSTAYAASDALRQGEMLFRSNRLQEAAEKFEEALIEDPSSKAAARNLGHTLVALGQKKLLAGDLEGARSLFEKALDQWSEEAAFHILLGVTFFRSGDLYGARRAVEEALYLEDDHPQARELLGDIYYQEGYLSRAIPEWERALENAGGRAGELKRKIERADRESDAESGFGRDISVHFTLQYDDGPVSRETVKAVLDHLEEAYDTIGGELGSYPNGDIPVILYSKVLFKEITQSPLWAAGTFDGKIRVPVGGLAGPRQVMHLRPILSHELAHAFIRNIASGRLPLWFEEGLAKHFEGLPTEIALRHLQRVGLSVPPSLAHLNRGLRASGRTVEASYIGALLAVRTLVESEGFWTVRRILEAVGRGESFEAAFREEARMEIAEFEERWRAELP